MPETEVPGLPCLQSDSCAVCSHGCPPHSCAHRWTSCCPAKHNSSLSPPWDCHTPYHAPPSRHSTLPSKQIQIPLACKGHFQKLEIRCRVLQLLSSSQTLPLSTVNNFSFWRVNLVLPSSQSTYGGLTPSTTSYVWLHLLNKRCYLFNPVLSVPEHILLIDE